MKKIRLNFIDIIIILVILTAIALLAYIFLSSDIKLFEGSRKVTIEYKVELRRVREEFRDFISISDHATDTVTQYALGEVVDVEYAPTRYTGVNRSTGSLVFSDYPEHINITVTIRAEATANGDDYSLNGYKVAVGKQISMRTPNFINEGYCTQLTEVGVNG
ncbi:MAG: DUF4330 domain-containing protein [Eubacteriales bacterium]|jgi:hypothetical protein|nr:DUF4330 domain-containing protein [Eubacteriales bacterium]